MAAPIPDRFGQLGKAESRVAGDDHLRQIEALEKCDRFHRLAAIGRHDKRTDTRLQACRESLQHMHSRARLALTTAPQAFAVNRDMAGRAVRGHEPAQCTLQIDRRNRLKNIVVGRVTWRSAAMNAKHFQTFGRQSTAKPMDRQ